MQARGPLAEVKRTEVLQINGRYHASLRRHRLRRGDHGGGWEPAGRPLRGGAEQRPNPHPIEGWKRLI